MAHKPSSDRAGSSAALQRGKACLRCRKRKMKCDGAKPACQQCVRAKKCDGCEYDDGKGKTRTQLLKETIAKLEDRVRQLESDPACSVTSPMVLFDPRDLAVYSAGSSSDSFGSPESSYMSAFPPTSEASPTTSWTQLQDAASPLAGGSSLQDIFFDERHSPFQPSNDVSVMLLDIFAPHARQCGLEMDMDALRCSVAVPTAEQHHSAFLNAIYLWACYISRPEALSQNEDHYLRLALEAMPDAIQKGLYVDAIRASCLLSTYLLSTGRLAEGAYHASAAAALADQLGLGKQVKESDMLDIKRFKTDMYEADRILAFWQVYNLDRCWSILLEKRPVIPDESRKLITVPWPQDVSEYKMGRVNAFSQGPTIQAFLAGSISASGFSAAALRVKGSALLSQADALSASWYRSGGKLSSQMLEEITNLENAIALYLSTLMPIDQFDSMRPEEKQSVIVAHTIAHTATILLHRPFASDDPVSAEKCAQASRSCVAMIKRVGEKEFSFLDPFIGPCWSWVTECDVSRLDSLERTWPLSDTSEVIDELATLMYAMNKLSLHFPIVAPVLSRVQKRLA